MPGVLLVTGGGRGIGAACARLAGQRGYAVCVNYHRSFADAESVVSDIRASGGKAIAVGADAASEGDVRRLFEVIDRELGPLSALINNAAILPHHGRVDVIAETVLEELWRVNLTGPMLCAREAVKRMSTRHGGKGGVIINLSSVAAKLGSPNTYVDYAASKGAIDSFTIGLGYEVAGEGIRVAGIRPGLIDTDIHASGGEPDRAQRLAHMVPMKRVGQAGEIANAIVWLLSDEASYVTAAILDVSGGR